MAERTLAEVREWAGRLLDPHGHNCTITPRHVDSVDCGDTDLEYRGSLGKFAAATGDSSEVLDLMCEAPCLAREVVRLADLAEAQAERIARLERVLAVERGDESQAPEGWLAVPPSPGCPRHHWHNPDSGRHVAFNLMTGHWWWIGGEDLGNPDRHDFSLDAMEAADAAMEATDAD